MKADVIVVGAGAAGLMCAIEAGKLFGLRLEGEWLHVGDPGAIAAAEARLAASVR